MELVILRHGQTDYNVDHRYAGVLDVPLNDAGRAQAAACGCAPDVGLVYTSHLSRARETARICFPNAHQIVRPALSEMDFGDFQNRNLREMETDPAYRAWVDAWCVPPCPHGESRDAYTARVTAAVVDALREQAASGSKRTIIVAHGGTVMAAFYALARPAEARDYYEWNPGNCHGFRAAVDFHGEGTDAQPDSALNALELHHIEEFADLGFLSQPLE